MALFERGDVKLHYELIGDGYPVLLIAPGGMQSTADAWGRTPWDPRQALADGWQLISMDQRNAGRSTAPISADDGWSTYTADQLALLDHLEIERCHVVGMCIGGPYIASLLKAAPERFSAAVMLQPVGVDDNTQAFRDMFGAWRDGLEADHPEVTDADWQSFENNMWDGDFLLTASRDEIAAIDNPLLVLMGDDLYHPQATSRAIAELAPHATLIENWKEGAALARAHDLIRAFLTQHTP